MKGQAKRFLNQKGKAYDMGVKIPSAKGNIGYLDLWRYATWGERCCTALGAVIAWVCSLAQITAVIVYGELTALFVERSAASATTPRAPILTLFGGGEIRAAGNRKLHMDALVNDSTAFALASITIMCIQLSCAATAVALANGAAAKMVTRVRLQLLRSVVSQEIAFFDTNTTMNFASAVTEDMEKLRAGVGQTIVMLSYLSGTVFCGCTLSLVYGWELTLAALAIVPFAILVQAVVAKNQTKCSEKETVAFNKAGRVTDEVLSAIRTVRAYAGEEMEVQRYSEALSGADKAVRRRGAWAGAGLGLGWLLTYSLNAVVFAYGAQLVVRDRGLPPDQQDYHPGIMVTILFCTFMAAQNIAMCSPHLEVIAAARGAAKSLFKILEKKSKINALENTGVKPDRFRGDIEFDNIYFNYPSRSDVKVLRGLSLKINAGETVALVGTSGCGKSTLLQLLQRMYEPDAGTVLVDGLRLNELNLHHFRTSIGVVGQEPVLFSGTIRDNITLGAGEVSEERVVAAAKTAHAHKFITKLADGYETVLGERGAALSGGQKQRIAIARAVLRNPAILLLDEPTSALDPTAERLVQSALDAASVGRTTLVVSHRLSTIENADRIVYVNLGTCAEQGTHSELVEKKGLYWNLLQQDMTHSFVTTQSETNDDDEPPALDELLTKEKSQAFVRSLSGRASYRGSFKAAWRQSASMRAPSSLAPAHDMLTEILEEEELQNETPVKGATALQLARLHKPEWCVLAIGGLASFTVGATMPAFAYLFSKLYGMFALSDGEAVLRASRLYAGLFFGVAALCGLVTFLQAWCFNLAGARLTHRLRKTTFQNFLIQEQAWFDQPENATGALGARLATDCAAVQGATGTRLGTVLQGISTMVLGVGLAMLYSWKMTLVSLLSVPCVIGGIYLEGWVNQRNAVREKRALEEAARLATEACLNIRTVQSLGIETLLTERFEAALREADSKAANGRRIRPFVYGLCQCAPTTGYAVSLAYGGYLIAREDLPYEYAILVSEALIYGAWMLAEALSFAPSFAAARRSATRIIAALSRKPLVVTEATATELKDWNCTGEVTYTNISFRYPSRPKTAIIRGLSVKLEAGKTIALVGPSGCGKSTLMHILLRNYDASEGTVTLDGHDIRHSLTLTQLRAQLGLVSQEPALFERSLRDNIAYGDNARSVPMEEIIHAAKQSNVHNFIVSLPMGYDTVLGQGGAALSGGQKQRVAIARALVRNPRVLLLDEATSALDADSEKKVQEALEVASKDRSTMIIAHRLATVRHAHTICVIAKGVVAESGSHDELVAKRGLYLELLKQQGGGGG